MLYICIQSRVYECRARGGGEYRTRYMYGDNRWESNVTSGILHARATNVVYYSLYIAYACAAAVLPVVYDTFPEIYYHVLVTLLSQRFSPLV